MDVLFDLKGAEAAFPSQSRQEAVGMNASLMVDAFVKSASQQR